MKHDFFGIRTPAHRQLHERVTALAAVVLVADIAGWLLASWAAGGSSWTTWAWATSQLLVGGSTFQLAGTSPGRVVLEVALQIVAVSVVAGLAGSLGAFFHRRGLERAPLTSDAGGDDEPPHPR
jgi:hypothetical protein